MKNKFVLRVLGMVLSLIMVLTMIPFSPMVMEADAVSGVDSLTCSGFISNSTARTYIDKMMRYYINSSSTLQSTLDNGRSVVFLFEGGSDYYWNGNGYSLNAYNVRNQGVCIVVRKNSSGNAYIAHYNENSSSIPGDPTWCTNGVAYSGSTTLMDGTYSFYTWNHTGPYAAFQINLTNSNGYCYYTPTENLNGYKAGASGINIHTRSTNIAAGRALGWSWSEGCQCIGYGNDTSNEFNAFMKAVCDITWNPWISWTNKTLNTWASSNVGIYKGYYVVDRQLGIYNPSGVEYGSGSLNALYNKTALTNITAVSTTARKAAGADVVDYTSECTFYPTNGTVKLTADDVWGRIYPCYSSVDSGSASISVYNTGETLAVTGLYKNTVGEYWYRTLSRVGSVVYINGAYAEFIKNDTSDIKITGKTTPNAVVKGNGFVVSGDIASTNSGLTTAACYIYKGFGVSGDAVTGASDTVTNNKYTLAGSYVDEWTWFGPLEVGNYTMHTTVAYKNYYVQNGTLKNYSGTIELGKDYFMVVSSAVTQSSCNHTYTTYVVKAATCTEKGTSVKACTTCGLVNSPTETTGSHKYGDWTTVAATCTTDGYKTRTCSACNNVDKQTIAATGHKYTSENVAATCTEYAKIKYTCSVCKDTYTTSAQVYNEWQTTKPEGFDDSLIETKTQYRYSDYQTITSSEPSVAGYTKESSKWVKNSTGTVDYVKSWPSGFNTSNSLYSTYSKAPKTASSDNYNKTTIDSDNVVGYLYYHWCYTDSYYSVESKSGNYTTFHAYYSTTAPSSYQCDTSDMSYCTSHSGCSNAEWYFVATVNQQKYTTYKAEYTHSRWTGWSDWSDTVATASSTKKVETRTVYRNKTTATYGPHKYVNDVCTLCGRIEPDYYLFGFINGADYGMGDDSANIGKYKFIDGKLSVKFSTNSYVAIKTGDNLESYMTNGYLGDDVTTATLYNTNSGINADKMFVPGGRQIDFTLSYNGDGTYTLSYEYGDCEHDNHDQSGNCTTCADKVPHVYEGGVCKVCSKVEPVYHLVGYINGTDSTSTDYTFVDGKLTATFTEHSYVYIMQGEGTLFYVTDGYPGDDVTSATLYNADTIDTDDKLRVPKGREITFTLVDNNDGTVLLSYEAAECDHVSHTTDGICITCDEYVGHRNIDGVCTVCGCNCEHVWNSDDICTKCSMKKPVYYLYGFVNGNDYDGLDYEFVGGKLTAKFTSATYVAVKTGDNNYRYMTDGYQGDEATSVQLYSTRVLGNKADKLYIPIGREITFTLTDNGDGTMTLSYTAAQCDHDSHNLNGFCNVCSEYVGHNLEDGVCTGCGHNCNHNYVNNVCTNCGANKPVFYLVGTFAGNDHYGTDYMFEDGRVLLNLDSESYVAIRTADNITYMTDGYLGDGVTSATLYNSITLGDSADKMYIPGGRAVVLTLTDNGDNTYTLSYTAGECRHPHHNTDAICSNCGQTVTHNWESGKCTVCGYVCKHTYKNDKCKYCGEIEPDYYLFGYINGVDYGSLENSENIGVYRFSNGKLMLVLTENSYVGVKTGDNQTWYMADGYPGEGATSAVLYDTNVGIDAEKLFVPKGRLITFTLTNNGDGSLTLSYVAAPCAHANHDTQGICYTCGEVVEHNMIQGVCTICGAQCEHSWVSGECKHCMAQCEHIYIDGKCTVCGFDCEHSYEGGSCTYCGLECDHLYKNSVCVYCGIDCTHKWLDRVCTECSAICKHNFKDGKCTECGQRCDHVFKNGVCAVCSFACKHKWYEGACTICSTTCKHTWEDGACTVCAVKCVHTWGDDDRCTTCGHICDHKFSAGICENCYKQCEHEYENGVCAICNIRCIHSFKGETCTVCGYSAKFYLVGDINGAVVGYDSNFESTGRFEFKDGKVTVEVTSDSYVFVKTGDNLNWYMVNGTADGVSATLNNTKNGQACSKMFIPGGAIVTFTLVSYENDTMQLDCTIDYCTHMNHEKDGTCNICGTTTEHTYINGVCAGCGDVVAYYSLFGDINDMAYGYESNYLNPGKYKFEDGKLTVKFSKDSYVAVKLSDNSQWFMAAESYTNGKQATLYNTSTGLGVDKMFVPGGVEVVFTLKHNTDGTLALSYETIDAPDPELNIKYTTVSLENEIMYKVYFTADNMDRNPAVEMGLVTFTNNNVNGTLADAYEILSGVTTQGKNLVASTNAIHPKNMGDTVYFKVYAVLSDSTVIYSDIMSYSVVRYANSILSSKNVSDNEKATVVALLNYGAEMQKYYGYKTDALVNAGLSSRQKALAAEYSSDMVVKASAVDSTKAGVFAKTGGNIMLYPTVSFDSTLMTLSFNLMTSKTPDDKVTLYYWDAKAYNSNEVLTAGNATGRITMTKDASGNYVASFDDIAMKNLNDVVYVSVVYTSAEVAYCSGVIGYSAAEYFNVFASKQGSDMRALAKAAIVYSYYCKNSFAS